MSQMSLARLNCSSVQPVLIWFIAQIPTVTICLARWFLSGDTTCQNLSPDTSLALAGCVRGSKEAEEYPELFHCSPPEGEVPLYTCEPPSVLLDTRKTRCIVCCFVQNILKNHVQVNVDISFIMLLENLSARFESSRWQSLVLVLGLQTASKQQPFKRLLLKTFFKTTVIVGEVVILSNEHSVL